MSDRQKSGQFTCDRLQRFAVVGCLLLHAILLAWIAMVTCPVFDEVGHLPSGLAHWQRGDFRCYRVNPPLMRMIAAAPLLATAAKIDESMISDNPFSRSEFELGSRFIEQSGSRALWYFMVGRWAQIPVSLLGAYVCYLWSRQLYGPGSGLVALVLWCFCPNLLAWGATITPDHGAAAFGIAAGYACWRWLSTPNWRNTFIAGCVLGLAQLTKSTWIILFVVWPAIWLVWRFSNRQQAQGNAPSSQLAAILGIALYVLNLGYGFEGTCQQLGQFHFVSSALCGSESKLQTGNRFRGTWLGKIPIPVPSSYLRGIDVQRREFESKKWSYLRGEQRRGGWYYYYAYALAVKLPSGAIAIIVLSTWLMVCRPEYRAGFRNEMLVLVPAIVLVAFVSSQTGFNRYFRYVLPAVPYFYVYASRIGRSFELRQRAVGFLCGLFVTATVCGSLSVFPHSMSYFNTMAGGPLKGSQHLLDANIDWGQDLLELKRFVDRHPEARHINVSYFGILDPKVVGLDCEPIPRLTATGDQMSVHDLRPGWYAISVNHLFGYKHYGHNDPEYACFRQFVPTAMAGYSIYIYHLTREDLQIGSGSSPGHNLRSANR